MAAKPKETIRQFTDRVLARYGFSTPWAGKSHMPTRGRDPGDTPVHTQGRG